MTTYELKPQYGQKSFYKKAYVKVCDNGESCLYSYDTLVCKIRVDNVGLYEIMKTWDDYSRTTMNHINSFLLQHGLYLINKKDWDSLPYYEWHCMNA